MPTKSDTLKNSRLTVILSPQDASRLGLSLSEIARQAVRGGADVIQLRDKLSDDDSLLEEAQTLGGEVRGLGALFIVNDRPRVARLAGADGVHLGQDDLPHAEARKLLGPDFLIGRSTHSLAQALAAQAEGADYIGYGPVFRTPTKPDYPAVGPQSIAEIARAVVIPFFAIGGIDVLAIESIAKEGARRVAVVRAAVETPNVFESVRRLKRELLKHDAFHPVT